MRDAEKRGDSTWAYIIRNNTSLFSDEAVIESRCVLIRGSLSTHICDEIQYGTLANNSNAGEKYSQAPRFKNSVICRVCHYLDVALRSLGDRKSAYARLSVPGLFLVL